MFEKKKIKKIQNRNNMIKCSYQHLFGDLLQSRNRKVVWLSRVSQPLAILVQIFFQQLGHEEDVLLGLGREKKREEREGGYVNGDAQHFRQHRIY